MSTRRIIAESVWIHLSCKLQIDSSEFVYSTVQYIILLRYAYQFFMGREYIIHLKSQSSLFQ